MNSWSNPNDGGATAAMLGNSAHIADFPIGQIVASILQAKQRQAEMKQQDQQAMMAGIAKGVSSGVANYENSQAQGSANDAANAAIYSSQYPNDPYGAYNDPNRVPDYGGTDSLKALEAARRMNPEAYMSPQDKALEAAKLDYATARAHNEWTFPAHQGDYGYNGYDLGDVRKQQIIDTQDAKDARLAASEAMGVTGPKLDEALAGLSRYQPGVNEFPAIGDNLAIPGADQGSYKDAVLAAAKRYQDQIAAIRARSQGLTTHQTTTPQQNGINPNDVAAAASAQGVPYGQEIPPEANPPQSAQGSTPDKNAPKASDTKSPSGVNVPKDGEVRKGYRYHVGDPKNPNDPGNPNSWEKVQ